MNLTPRWPELPHDAWADTLETLHLWTQIVGKVRMECSPWINHSWSVPLYVTARSLGTGPFPHGDRRRPAAVGSRGARAARGVAAAGLIEVDVVPMPPIL